MSNAESASPGSLFFDAAHSNVADNIIILQADSLLEAAVAFASRSTQPLRLCADATHDFGLQGWKLVAVGLLGVQYRNLEWHVTFLPMGYAVSIQETREAG
eukprot:5010883-Karenia_brevis.AAC.1